MGKRSSAEQFNEAERLYQDRDYESALEILKILTFKYPETKNILFAQARCFMKLGDFEAAENLCKKCIRQWDSPRAKELLHRIQNQGQKSDHFQELESANIEFDTELSEAFYTEEEIREPSFERFLKPALFLIVALFMLSGFVLGVKLFLERMPDSEFERGNGAQSEGKENQIAGNRSDVPGQIIGEEEWSPTAINDLPNWKPGIYQNIPCIGSTVRVENGGMLQLTVDVYIPMAYQERPSELFPVVFISWSSMNPGFIGLADWAENNDAILVAINAVSNEMYASNWKSQDEALALVAGSMRVDMRMGIAIGMSGGAASSWETICRYPDYFVGVVMLGMAGSQDDCRLPTNVRVGYIYGQRDQYRKAIEQKIPALRSDGHEVHFQMVPGGHVPGPVHVREQMLTWILEEARKERGGSLLRTQ